MTISPRSMLAGYSPTWATDGPRNGNLGNAYISFLCQFFHAAGLLNPGLWIDELQVYRCMILPCHCFLPPGILPYYQGLEQAVEKKVTCHPVVLPGPRES